MARNYATGDTVLGRLADAGVIPEGSQRVVIDICIDSAVMMYVQSVADTDGVDILESLLTGDDFVVVKSEIK